MIALTRLEHAAQFATHIGLRSRAMPTKTMTVMVSRLPFGPHRFHSVHKDGVALGIQQPFDHQVAAGLPADDADARLLLDARVQLPGALLGHEGEDRFRFTVAP